MNGFELQQSEIDKTLDIYFETFKNIFEAYTYENFEDISLVSVNFKDIKSYLDMNEEETGLKLFYDLNGVYYALTENNIDDVNSGLIDHLELQKLCFNLILIKCTVKMEYS